MLAQKKMPDGKKEELSQVCILFFFFDENKNVDILTNCAIMLWEL